MSRKDNVVGVAVFCHVELHALLALVVCKLCDVGAQHKRPTAEIGPSTVHVYGSDRKAEFAISKRIVACKIRIIANRLIRDKDENRVGIGIDRGIAVAGNSYSVRSIKGLGQTLSGYVTRDRQFEAVRRAVVNKLVSVDHTGSIHRGNGQRFLLNDADRIQRQGVIVCRRSGYNDSDVIGTGIFMSCKRVGTGGPIRCRSIIRCGSNRNRSGIQSVELRAVICVFITKDRGNIRAVVGLADVILQSHSRDIGRRNGDRQVVTCATDRLVVVVFGAEGRRYVIGTDVLHVGRGNFRLIRCIGVIMIRYANHVAELRGIAVKFAPIHIDRLCGSGVSFRLVRRADVGDVGLRDRPGSRISGVNHVIGTDVARRNAHGIIRTEVRNGIGSAVSARLVGDRNGCAGQSYSVHRNRNRITRNDARYGNGHTVLFLVILYATDAGNERQRIGIARFVVNRTRDKELLTSDRKGIACAGNDAIVPVAGRQGQAVVARIAAAGGTGRSQAEIVALANADGLIMHRIGRAAINLVLDHSSVQIPSNGNVFLVDRKSLIDG